MRSLVIPLFCLITLHEPGGGDLLIETVHISAIRPVSQLPSEHFAPGTKAVVYTSKVFGVAETEEEVVRKMESCEWNK